MHLQKKKVFKTEGPIISGTISKALIKTQEKGAGKGPSFASGGEHYRNMVGGKQEFEMVPENDIFTEFIPFYGRVPLGK